jgi:hypothetical protein
VPLVPRKKYRTSEVAVVVARTSDSCMRYDKRSREIANTSLIAACDACARSTIIQGSIDHFGTNHGSCGDNHQQQQHRYKQYIF